MSTGEPTTKLIRSRAQRVAAEIEDDILASRLPEGTRLGVRAELLRRFGISPTVLNEALRILRDRELVTVRPGVNGGVFVASQPPQVRLGALDLWFAGTSVEPLQLFEARMHLEETFAQVALHRATPEDIRTMEWALEDMRTAGPDPRRYLDANMRFHLAIARASRVEVLAGLYQSLVTILSGSLTRAEYLDQHNEMLQHNLDVHADMVSAIRDHDQTALDKIMQLHRHDMVRAADPTRSPGGDET
jgi:DNA-binding FadR family transcriptional regulator